MRYLDPVVLARLRNLRLDLRRHLVEGHLTGRHRSSLHGFSQEFAQHRLYAPGDELKRLDWKVYARRDRFFIRQYEEEKSLKTYVLLDASGSMSFQGAGPEPKWELACRLALSMAYLVLAQGDRAGLVTFDTGARDFLPPRGGFPHLELMDRTLSEARPGGETDLGAALHGTAGRMTRRSLVILVSDLLGDGRRVLETLKAFQARKHRLFVLQVLDPSERDLGWEGPVLFEGLEEPRRLRCEASLLRDGYRDLFSRRQRLYEASFRGSGVRHGTFYTDMPWERSLTRFLGGACSPS